MSTTGNGRRDVLDEHALRMGAGFTERDRSRVPEVLSALAPHLGRWDPSDVDVEVSVKDRDGKEQRVTLRVTLPGLPPLMAVATDQHLVRALGTAKRELIRQIEDQKSAREPKNNRHLRSKTIRHLGTPRTPRADSVTCWELRIHNDSRRTDARGARWSGPCPTLVEVCDNTRIWRG
jgi:hypothetical protein